MENQYIVVCVILVLLLGVPVQGWTWDDAWCVTKTYGGTVAVGAGAVAAAPVLLGAAGFTAGGIAAGSLAAKAMAASAVTNGGGVVAGGIVATLQATGVTGLGIAGKAAVAGTAGGIYRYFVGGCSYSDDNK